MVFRFNGTRYHRRPGGSVSVYVRSSMIRPERLTIKAQEAVRDAGELARSRGNPVVNDAHLLAALLAQEEGVVQPLLQKAGLNVTAIRQEVEREIGRFPTQAGAGAEPSLS